MKTCFYIKVAAIFFVGMVLLSGCVDELQSQIDDLDSRLSHLEDQSARMNSDIKSLQTIVNALSGNDYIESVTPIIKNNETVGYTISFAKNGPIEIYHGEDGHSPEISVRQDVDGIYYWVLDGEWILDTRGKKIKVTGTAPELKIQNDRWLLSMDGLTWTDIGQATGETLFSKINVTQNFVIFTMSDGREFNLRRYAPLSISFNTEDLVVMDPNSTREIGYEITSESNDVIIEALSSSDIKVKIQSTDALSGNIVVTTGSEIDEYSKVVVLVSDGTQIIMETIHFEETALTVMSGTLKEVSSSGGEVWLYFLSNTDYYVEIPAEAQDWISVSSIYETNTQNIMLAIAPETEGIEREAEVKVRAVDSEMSLTYTIRQESLDTSPIIQFNDPHFLEQLSQVKYYTLPGGQFVISDVDENDDGKISEREAASAKEVVINGSQNLEDISELRYFTNVETLVIKGLPLVKSIDLSNNQALKVVYIVGCDQLPEMSLNDHTQIETVYLDNPMLTSVDLSNNTAMSYLKCNGPVTSLNITGCTAIAELDLQNCKLESLDLSNSMTITEVRLADTEIESVDFSGCSALTDFTLSGSFISSLDLSRCTTLTKLT